MIVCRSHGPPGGARVPQRRRGVLHAPRQATANWSRVGGGVPRRLAPASLPVGQQAEAARSPPCQYLAGEPPSKPTLPIQALYPLHQLFHSLDNFSFLLELSLHLQETKSGLAQRVGLYWNKIEMINLSIKVKRTLQKKDFGVPRVDRSFVFFHHSQYRECPSVSFRSSKSDVLPVDDLIDCVCGRVGSRTRTRPRTATRRRLRSTPFQPTHTACTIWSATSGSGRLTGGTPPTDLSSNAIP